MAGSAAGWMQMCFVFCVVLAIFWMGPPVLIFILNAYTPVSEFATIYAFAGICVEVFRVIFALPIMIGGRSLASMRSYGLAMTGAVVALFMALFYLMGCFGLLIPLNLRNVPGAAIVGLVVLAFISFALAMCLLIAGIKGLMALNNPDVKARFQANAEKRASRDSRHYPD
jgi:hypothetical protein